MHAPHSFTHTYELERLVDAYKIGDLRAPAFDATLHLGSGQIKPAWVRGSTRNA
ncbi:MAG: hypothetical protein M3O70_05860 [Actinomycetota bacterium]|nr:hypothetical protein [Actinomycetota bacterium]